jgi:hypothetical protein
MVCCNKHDYYSRHHAATWFSSKHNVLEAGSVYVLRYTEGIPTQLGPSDRASLDHCTAKEILTRQHSYPINVKYHQWGINVDVLIKSKAHQRKTKLCSFVITNEYQSDIDIV